MCWLDCNKIEKNEKWYNIVIDRLNTIMEETQIYPQQAGIYKLTCINNGKIYIGKTVNFRKRLNDHKHCGRNGKSGFYLKNAIVKHGWESFTVQILETVDNFDKLKDNIALLERESYFIRLFNSFDREKGYNLCISSTDKTGLAMSAESRRKMSESQKGKKHSEETKKKMSQARLGKPNLACLGRKHSEEAKIKIGNAHRGRKLSEKTKEKIRQTKSENPMSEKEKIRIGNLNRGKKHSEESKEKMRKPKPRKIKNCE